jgi:TrmH family RNA methyltransferase
MIAVRKLLSLSPKHGARKAANTLDLAERAYRAGDCSYAAWIREFCAAFAPAEYLGAELRALMALCATPAPSAPAASTAPTAPFGLDGYAGLGEPESGARLANRLRRGLEAYGGVSPADWDFLEPLGLPAGSGGRRVFPGVRAYLEDLRSPFNVGSIFRTADAFGAQELYLSGFVPEPSHPRAQRSALGAIAMVSWRRAGLEALEACRAEEGPEAVFALELRGQSIDGFDFPERGIAVLGSEELGVSPEALALCSRRVSIPMLGAKGSLNVGVAFGVLMDAWRRSLMARGVEPQRVL